MCPSAAVYILFFVIASICINSELCHQQWDLLKDLTSGVTPEFKTNGNIAIHINIKVRLVSILFPACYDVTF